MAPKSITKVTEAIFWGSVLTTNHIIYYLGIAYIQEFYNLNITDFVNGLIHDPHTGKRLQASKNMSLTGILFVCATLIEDEIYDKNVEWLEAAYNLIQKQEGHTEVEI